MKIDFLIRFSTKFGQKLSIIGNIPALGENNYDEAMDMHFLNKDFWHASVEVDPSLYKCVQYRYLLTTEEGEVIFDAEKEREIHFKKGAARNVLIIDSWNAQSFFENAFYTTPFQEVILKDKKLPKVAKAGFYTHTFKAKAPLLAKTECLCLLGNTTNLKNWDYTNPILMEKSGNWWVARVNLAEDTAPVAYKYGIFDFVKGEFVRFEEGDNRVLLQELQPATELILHDGFVRLSNNQWRGAGVAIPVFSLRSANSFGIGEFADLKLLADWASQVGMKLIQLLPINDTSSTFTWKDSYPYSAISAFALHPIYINLQKLAGKKHAALIKPLSKKQKQLNSLPEVDYEQVLKIKLDTLKELYELEGKEMLETDDFQNFFQTHRHWLVPYAAFCFLRDKYGTAEFSKWKANAVYSQKEIERLTSPKGKQFESIAFWYYVQYQLHLQLQETVNYVHKKGIVLKGDIPIGISRNSCDAWTNPELYNMDQQAGAPPDDFAVKGQNWGFPTYNWQIMQENNFEWWRQRFHQMSLYFDAFRIDHILGFFRIWSIPTHAVEGIMGVFVPALPIHINEFGEKGIWFDYNRFCKPYITDAVIDHLFGSHAEMIRSTFLTRNERNTYDLLEEFDTQVKVQQYFNNQPSDEADFLKQGLFDLISNVLLFEQQGSGGTAFHFRISMENTLSFQHLEEHLKYKFKELYVEYFYHRQDEFWRKEAMKKLPALKEVTNMLICGEDLGMVPHSVPVVMQQLGILSLEIQRMPKNPQTEFFHPATAPYLSVVTPSTHDMSTIRGWWEENKEKTQRFFNYVLQEGGAAPDTCESWINRAIILQHLYSPAMWSIFQLQDLFGMNDVLRRENPNEERINDPANSTHYWNYRIHLPLEQLIKETSFNNELKEYLLNSGRNTMS